MLFQLWYEILWQYVRIMISDLLIKGKYFNCRIAQIFLDK